jgi:hypothetical protein
MERGDGPSLYPLPLLCNPSILKENFVELNSCPCCKLCYNCHNYIFSDCGHSYHLWCLLEHLRVSSKCLVKDYEVNSLIISVLTWVFAQKWIICRKWQLHLLEIMLQIGAKN